MLEISSVTQRSAYYCGPACLEMVLAYFGIRASQTRLGKIAGTTRRRGTGHEGMARALRSYGFRVLTKQNTTSFADLQKYVERCRLPVIVNWYAALRQPAVGHYSVVIGVNRSTITLMDPEIGGERTLTLRTFTQLWFDFSGDLKYETPPLKTYFRWMLVAFGPRANKRIQD